MKKNKLMKNVMLSLVVLGGIFLAGCNSNQKNVGSLMLKVNPELEIFYNKDGKVTNIKPHNDDGKKIIKNFDYIGKETKLVVKDIVEIIKENGYFEVTLNEKDGKIITLDLSDGSDDIDDDFLEEIKEETFNKIKELNIIESKDIVLKKDDDKIIIEKAKNDNNTNTINDDLDDFFDDNDDDNKSIQQNDNDNDDDDDNKSIQQNDDDNDDDDDNKSIQQNDDDNDDDDDNKSIQQNDDDNDDDDDNKFIQQNDDDNDDDDNKSIQQNYDNDDDDNKSIQQNDDDNDDDDGEDD